MPSYEDFKVGDVWIRRDGEAGTVERIDTEDKTILIFFVDFTLWYHGSGRALRQEDKYDLIHKKKLDTSKPVRRIDGGNECYTIVGKTTRGDLIVEAGNGCVHVFHEDRLENAEKRKKTVDLVLLDVGGKLHITSSECADQTGVKLLGRKTVEIEEGEGL